jgi:hypothetical protein
MRSMKAADPPNGAITRRALIGAFCATAACGAKPGRALGAEAGEAAALIAEVRKSFTLRGKPIPPEIFRDFGDGNLADSASIWTSVDLDAAVGSNLYFDPIRTNGAWTVQGRAAGNGREAEETAYRYIGTTKNGLLVVVASYNGGGTGVFHTLHILDLSPARAFDDEGKVATRIALANLRSVPLGDRWDGDATISGDEVRIVTRAGAGNAPKTIQARRP